LFVLDTSMSFFKADGRNIMQASHTNIKKSFNK